MRTHGDPVGPLDFLLNGAFCGTQSHKNNYWAGVRSSLSLEIQLVESPGQHRLAVSSTYTCVAVAQGTVYFAASTLFA